MRHSRGEWEIMFISRHRDIKRYERWELVKTTHIEFPKLIYFHITRRLSVCNPSSSSTNWGWQKNIYFMREMWNFRNTTQNDYHLYLVRYAQNMSQPGGEMVIYYKVFHNDWPKVFAYCPGYKALCGKISARGYP